MGWFSDSYVTTVGTSVSRVVQEDDLPNHRKVGLLRALLKHEDIPENIIGSMVANLPMDVDRMHKYGRDHYTHGLPSGDFVVGPENRGDFFPFAYFRFNKKSEAADTTTESYKTSKKLVKYLGMDFDAVAAAIDENPDIADVEQAMLMLGVPAYSQIPLEMRYLFEFFRNVWSAGAVQFLMPMLTLEERYLIQESDSAQVPNTTAIVIQDRRFKMALGNNGISHEIKTGNVAVYGKYACDVLPKTITVPFIQVTGEGGYVVTTRTTTVFEHRYFYQHAKEQNIQDKYTEVRVVNMRMNYHVFGEYLSTADGLEEILLIPLDKSICDDYTIKEREYLYARSFHFVFNSRVVTKVKWYQTSEFMMFITAVGFAIAIFTYGQSLSALAAALTSASAIAVTAAVIVIIEDILIALMTAYALKLFVQAVGVKFALILAVILVLVGVGMKLEGSVAGAPWVTELLSLGNGLSKAASADLQDSMIGLQKEINEFSLLMDTKSKELEAANKLLQHNNWLSPTIFFGETPEDFYNRTVHSGNIGVVGIGAISSYVDIALTLPKINESVGGN